VPGSPVTCAQPRTAGTCGCLHVDPRQEPGAVVPHAGICAGGGRVTDIPTATGIRFDELGSLVGMFELPR